jgi:hypothetical protein
MDPTEAPVGPAQVAAGGTSEKRLASGSRAARFEGFRLAACQPAASIFAPVSSNRSSC